MKRVQYSPWWLLALLDGVCSDAAVVAAACVSRTCGNRWCMRDSIALGCLRGNDN